MLNFFKLTDFKVLGITTLIVIVITVMFYQHHKIKSLDVELSSTSNDLLLSRENNKLIIDAYEQTLKVEREIAKEQTVTTEAKEKVVVKYKTLIKEVEKRGEIKPDENSNFTIVSF